MKRLADSPLAKWLLVALACAPLGLYLWLGAFTRLIADDYHWLALGKTSGLWGMLHQHLTTWTSAFSRTFLVGLLLPLDSAVAPLMAVALVLLWCAALAWLLWLAAGRAGYGRGKLPLALSCVLISATIYGMHSHQSFYWLVASTAYTLPIVPLLFCGGVALLYTNAGRSRARSAVAVLALGTICFVNAGFSEMFLVFQFVLLSGLIVATCFLASSARRPLLLSVGAAWVGTFASAMAQLNAPGLAARVNSQEYLTLERAAPVRSLPALLSKTLETTFEHIGHQAAFAGFTLALAGGALGHALPLSAEDQFAAGATPTLEIGRAVAGLAGAIAAAARTLVAYKRFDAGPWVASAMLISRLFSSTPRIFWYLRWR